MVWRLLYGILAVGLLGGCHAAGMVALQTANGIAALGPHDRVTDIPYGPEDRQQLDIYTPRGARDPRTPRDPRPVVVFFHGGDWSEGYPGKEAHRFVADALTSRGFVAVLPNYRRYPEVRFPAFVEDAAAAVVWTHRHAADFGGDPDQLFVMGHSAGAHLAAMVTVDERYLLAAGGDPGCIAGLIGLAGPYTFLPMPDDPLLKELFGPPSQYPLSQAVNFVDHDEPPMLLLSGGRDQRVPLTCTQRLADRVRGVGGRVQTRNYQHLDHIMLVGSLAFPVRWYDRGVLDDVDQFVRHVAAATPPTTDNITAAATAQTPATEPPSWIIRATDRRSSPPPSTTLEPSSNSSDGSSG